MIIITNLLSRRINAILNGNVNLWMSNKQLNTTKSLEHQNLNSSIPNPYMDKLYSNNVENSMPKLEKMLHEALNELNQSINLNSLDFDLDTSVWNRLCEAREMKVFSEFKVRFYSAKLSEISNYIKVSYKLYF